MSVQKPIDYNRIRTAIARYVSATTGCVAILAEQKGQTTQPLPRPELPYFTFKFITAALKEGDDSSERIGNAASTVYNSGGQRRIVCSFNCYAPTQEQAYELMSLLQASFDLKSTRPVLGADGIAHLTSGAVADLSALLQTGYEARSQMDVNFGIASNMTEDLGRIESVEGEGTVTPDADLPPVTDPFEASN